MPVIRIGVVGHRDREDAAIDLARTVRANYCNIDDGTLGCRGNHVAMWEWHTKHRADWHVVLEDDAQPVEGFGEQLAAALEVAPAPIVSLYLGCGYVDDLRTRALIDKAEGTGAHWLLTRGRVLHAVGLAIRGELLDPTLAALSHITDVPIDRSMSMWARAAGHQVAYTMPSLVDHADGDSLVTPHRRRRPRKAWRLGGREQWCSTLIRMV